MSGLYPLRLVAPGFYGLNTQLNTTPGLQWMSQANNCVIDAKGRLAARKGRNHVTSSAIGGTPAVRAVFEQVTSDGTVALISAAGNKLYSGTATLTERTGTAGSVTGVTADHWQLQNIANKCVGFQAGHDPIVRTTGNFSLLQQSITAWAVGTVYAVGDVVRATSGNETLYFHCTTTGTSHAATEPTWNTSVGGTTADNTVVWTTRKMPNGNVCHSAFGRIWVTSDGDASVVEFSDTLLPHIFRGGAAGTLDLKEVWGGDQVTAIGSIEDYLVIFGKRTILLYSGAFDPSAMVLEEKIDGVGCIARDTPANTGNDLLFLSASGVRSLARAIEAGGRQSLGDLSINVRDAFMDEVGAETTANVKASYHEADGFYAVFLTDDDITWVFDRRFPNPDGSAKVTRWTGIGVRAAYSASDRILYFGGDGVVAKYNGYNDGAGTYVLTYRSTWVDFAEADPSGRIGLASRIKVPKSWRLRVLAGTNYNVTYTWGFDYAEAISSLTDALSLPSSPSEWGVAEWGEGEWSGGDIFGDARVHPSSHGQVLRIGMAVTVDAAAIAFQEILLAAKLGRLAF
jgi:hypothetical protein